MTFEFTHLLIKASRRGTHATIWRRVVKTLPKGKELYGIAVANPVLNGRNSF